MRSISLTRRNRKRALSAVLLAMAAAAVAPAAQADAAYEIKPRHSGKCLDVAWASQWNGANVGQWSCNGGYNQQFSLQYTDSDYYGKYYKIVARHSGKCLDVEYGSRGDGANIQQYTCGAGYNQQFRLRYIDSGYYQLIARHSFACVDVAWASTWDGANVHQWGCNGGGNQQFRFVYR
ncbi:MAG TPA: RICIN domain-containing protein [Solirubrobacteraceae bacterium]|nr:RICIN domain-containing protein [Solirubrobacteraceae bacterium]